METSERDEEQKQEIAKPLRLKAANRRRTEWQGIVAKYRASGETAVEFGNRTGINPGTLLWWHRKLKKEEPERCGKFVEIKLPEREAEYRIRFKSGHELAVSGGFSLNRVSELAKLLAGETC